MKHVTNINSFCLTTARDFDKYIYRWVDKIIRLRMMEVR